MAVVGAGPAGLTAAYYLVKQGHGVTVFEELPLIGGMLRFGIPLEITHLTKELAVSAEQLEVSARGVIG